MVPATLAVVIIVLSLPLASLAASNLSQMNETQPSFERVCRSISSVISSASDVYYPGQLEYARGISHWAISSTQMAACVVEPGTSRDVAAILRIIAATRTPFAVKGGGHATNPEFSSTTGVHVFMTRFDEVTYNEASQTAVVGAGLVWDDVYKALAPHKVNVVGGRVTGIGVAGFTLGGGYSWKTNQYGLTIDTVTAFELVKPDGDVVTVTQASHPALFFGLKGGYNNFGVVTKFTFKTFPQTQVWGGPITILSPFIANVSAATAAFTASVTDPKAGIITTYDFASGQPLISLLLFYDAPTPPTGIFDDFLAIPFFSKDVSTRDFLSLVQSFPSDSTIGTRGIFNSVSVLQYTPNILDVILNETIFWGNQLSSKSAFLISYEVEPFLPSIYSHNPETTAFPPRRSIGFLPFNIYYAWNSSEFDNDFHETAKISAATVLSAAIDEGQTALVGSPVYPNYAIFDTPLVKMYGTNLLALRALKSAVDPNNVMGLAGGFKF